MLPVLLNLAIALVWLFLGDAPTLGRFLAGYLIGFAALAVFPKMPGGRAYVRRSFALARFTVVFLLEFLKSNLSMARAVLFRNREDIHPNFIIYDTRGLTPFEILLLGHCITLTPGTTTVEIAPDFSHLILHAFDDDDPGAIRRGIDARLRKTILAFTR